MQRIKKIILIIGLIVALLCVGYKNRDNTVDYQDGEILDIEQNEQMIYDDFSISIMDIDSLLQNKVIGVVYFGRDTCSFCLAFNSILRKEYTESKNVTIYKFDTDYWRENDKFQTVLDKYDITNIPALIRIHQDNTFEKYLPDEDDDDIEVEKSLLLFLEDKK